MQRAFIEIFKRLARVNATACIAGGAVVDFERAADIDIFVLDALDTDGIETDIMQEVTESLHMSNYTYADPAGSQIDGYFGERALFASGQAAYTTKRIEVVATSFGSVEDLIDSFDLSIHAWALKNPHHIVGSMLNSTSRWESPRVMRWTTPEATLARMMKLVDRYRVPVSTVDWKRLKALIEKEKHGKSSS